MTGSEIGKWARARRKELGLTLDETESLTGISRRTIIRIEDGNLAASSGNVAALVQALGGRIMVEEDRDGQATSEISTDAEAGED